MARVVARSGTVVAPPVWGIVWFTAAMVVLWVGLDTLAVAAGLVAAAAAWQLTGPWAEVGVVGRVVAVVCAGAVALSARLSATVVGLVVLAAVAVTLLVSLLGAGRVSIVGRAGLVIQSWFVPAIAAASVVLVAGYELGAAVVLVWLTCAYDAGTYLIGTGADRSWHGPVAGVVAVAAVAFTATELGIPPLEPGNLLLLGALAAVTVPAGPMVAAWLSPDGAVRSGMIGRADSLFVAAPAWAWVAGLEIADRSVV